MVAAVLEQPSTVADLCSVIWKATEVLKTSTRYKKLCKTLREALLKLHEVLKNVEVDYHAAGFPD